MAKWSKIHMNCMHGQRRNSCVTVGASTWAARVVARLFLIAAAAAAAAIVALFIVLSLVTSFAYALAIGLQLLSGLVHEVGRLVQVLVEVIITTRNWNVLCYRVILKIYFLWISSVSYSSAKRVLNRKVG